MAIVDLGPFKYPEWVTARPIASTTSKNTATINDASDVVLIMFSATASATIEQIWLESGAINTTGDIRISIQDTASGTYGPNNTSDGVDDYYVELDASNTNIFFQSGPVTDDGTSGGNRKTVNPGDVIGIAIKRASGSSYDGGITYINTTLSANEFDDQIPILTPNIFISSDGGSSYSFQGGVPNIAIELTDGSFMKCSFVPVEFFSQETIGSATSPDEIGNVIIPEMTCEVRGAYNLGGNRNMRIRIYDASDTVIAEVRTGTHGGTSSRGNYRYHYFDPVTLNASQTYRLAYEALDSSDDTLFSATLPASQTMGAYPLGTGCYWTERTNAGAWTDNKSKRACCGLVVFGIDTTINTDRGPTMFRVGSGINSSVARIF